jgi:Leucine-rich repeat (LRR) protein
MGAKKKSVFFVLYLYATATTSTPSIGHVFVSQQPLFAVSISFNSRAWGKPAWCYSVSTLRALAFLHLTNNHLSQRLPEGLSCCTALKALRLSDNKFKGSLPDLASCSRLLLLEAANNKAASCLRCP